MIIYKGLKFLKSLNLKGLVLQTVTATEMLRYLPNLSDVQVQNNYRDRNECGVIMLLCSSFMTVDNVIARNSDDGFRISGTRRLLDPPLCERGVSDLFEGTPNTKKLFPSATDVTCKNFLGCLPSGKGSVISLDVTGAIAASLPLLLDSDSCSDLTSLSVTWAWEAFLSAFIAKPWRALVKLSLVGTNFDDTEIVLLCEQIPALTHLTLAELDIGNVALKEGVAKNLHKLVNLTLSQLMKVTRTAVAATIKANPLLQTVNINKCANVGRDTRCVVTSLKALQNLCSVSWEREQWWG
jgi:hypothetical protein